MINKKIIDILKPLNIPVYYMSCSKQTDKYLVFSIYNEKDTDKFDNTNLSETYYITLNYWYKNASDIVLYKQIKQLLKDNNFRFDGGNDSKDGDYFGKNLDFIYKKLFRHL